MSAFEFMTYALFFLVAVLMFGGAVLLAASGFAEQFRAAPIYGDGDLDD